MTSQRIVEADYVIIGAGAVAMAFADTLLSDSNADMIIVDRRAKPGGHWNDAYPFIRLHSPSAYYGVNSRPLGGDKIDETGLNRGLQELATGAETCAYFDRVMHQRFLPSGRVTWLPLCDYSQDGVATSRLSGAKTTVRARKKIVDATFADTRTPQSHPPAYVVAPGVRCIPPHALAGLNSSTAGFTIIGAGKTAMDTALFLLEHGVDPDAITWIRPRDPWLLNRARLQVSDQFFAGTFGGMAAEMEAARDAASINDLFLRLEAAGQLLRIDLTVTPQMYRCAICTEAEVEAMRRIQGVVRLGRVTALERERIVLEGGAVLTSPQHVHIDCSADGIPNKSPVPIFQPGRIVPQYVRRCSPTFSGAFVAHLEATLEDDAQKNALAAPVPAPHVPNDWLRMHLQGAKNASRWMQAEGLQSWLSASRLDGFGAMLARAMINPNPTSAAIFQRYREALQPGLARMAQLLATAS
jgi:hypothetical protein